MKVTDELVAKCVEVFCERTAYWPPENFSCNEMISFAIEEILDVAAEESEVDKSE